MICQKICQPPNCRRVICQTICQKICRQSSYPPSDQLSHPLLHLLSHRPSCGWRICQTIRQNDLPTDLPTELSREFRLAPFADLLLGNRSSLAYVVLVCGFKMKDKSRIPPFTQFVIIEVINSVISILIMFLPEKFSTARQHAELTPTSITPISTTPYRKMNTIARSNSRKGQNICTKITSHLHKK